MSDESEHGNPPYRIYMMISTVVLKPEQRRKVSGHDHRDLRSKLHVPYRFVLLDQRGGAKTTVGASY
jgi:hypothetical protein